MYAVIVIGLMLVLPVASLALALSAGAAFWSSLATWFIFWAVGVRLALAGLRQLLRPEATLREIFQDTRPDNPVGRRLVTEIGMGNLALGTTGMLSLAFPDWRVPVAVTGAIFYGLAGFGHLQGGATSTNERLAMWSDFGAAGLLILVLVAAAIFGLGGATAVGGV